MSRTPECIHPACRRPGLSWARYTKEQCDQFPELAMVKLKRIPCATYRGMFHTMPRVAVRTTERAPDGPLLGRRAS